MSEQSPQSWAIRMFAAKLGLVMPFWYALGLVMLLIETFIVRHDSAVVPLAIAGGIWALVIVLSLAFLVPINNQLARSALDESTATIERAHRKWDALHRFRVVALTASMVVLLVSVL
jgi:hypothetical protein